MYKRQPLGIAVSAGLGLISDSYRVVLNGKPAKLFRSGRVTVLELLMMNGFTHSDLLGRSGKSLMLYLDGKRTVFYGEPALPARPAINGVEAKPVSYTHLFDAKSAYRPRLLRSKLRKPVAHMISSGIQNDLDRFFLLSMDHNGTFQIHGTLCLLYTSRWV